FETGHLPLKAVYFGLGLIWRRAIYARFVERYDTFPMFNNTGISPPQRCPDYCAEEQHGRSKNQRSLRAQPDFTQDILNELLRHRPILTERAESMCAAGYLII